MPHPLPEKALITAASNKFVPSLLNFIGSIKTNYPNHPPLFIYDLGISSILRSRIEKIERVTILSVPHFTEHWRSCYTWKTYILDTPLARLNFYIDAGTEVLRPLDSLFTKIDQNGYLAVSQGHEITMGTITPPEYFSIFNLETEEVQNKEVIAAGIFGFKNETNISSITDLFFKAGKDGLCIGFSKAEQWKNKGVNSNTIVRNCDRFRHDTTVLSLLLYAHIQDIQIEPLELFDGRINGNPDQYLWSVRMNFSTLTYAKRIAHHDIILYGYYLCFITIKFMYRSLKRFRLHISS